MGLSFSEVVCRARAERTSYWALLIIIEISRQFFVQLCSEHGARAVSQSAVAGDCLRGRWNFEILEHLEELTSHWIRKACDEPRPDTYRVLMSGKGLAVVNDDADERKQLSVFEGPRGPIGQQADAVCALICPRHLPGEADYDQITLAIGVRGDPPDNVNQIVARVAEQLP